MEDTARVWVLQVIAMMITEVKRMGHIPHPPLWNAVEIAVSI